MVPIVNGSKGRTEQRHIAQVLGFLHHLLTRQGNFRRPKTLRNIISLKILQIRIFYVWKATQFGLFWYSPHFKTWSKAEFLTASCQSGPENHSTLQTMNIIDKKKWEQLRASEKTGYKSLDLGIVDTVFISEWSRILLRSKFWYEDCIRDGQIEWLISCVLWSAKLVSLLLSYVWNHQGKGFGRCRTLYQVDIEFYGAEAKARLKPRTSFNLLTFVNLYFVLQELFIFIGYKSSGQKNLLQQIICY